MTLHQLWLLFASTQNKIQRTTKKDFTKKEESSPKGGHSLCHGAQDMKITTKLPLKFHCNFPVVRNPESTCPGHHYLGNLTMSFISSNSVNQSILSILSVGTMQDIQICSFQFASFYSSNTFCNSCTWSVAQTIRNHFNLYCIHPKSPPNRRVTKQLLAKSYKTTRNFDY